MGRLTFLGDSLKFLGDFITFGGSDIVTVGPTTSTKWSSGDFIPRGGLEGWHGADNATPGSLLITDLSGNGRDLFCATNEPSLELDVLNGQPGVYFDGTNDPLIYDGAVDAKHIFVVASFDDDAFPADLPGLLSDQAGFGMLVGDNAGSANEWYDFNADYTFNYYRRDVEYPHAGMLATMDNVPSIYELIIPAGLALDGIQVGRDRDFLTRLWKGYYFENLIYSTVKNSCDRLKIYQYLAMKYWLWPRVASGLDVFPFFGNKSRGSDTDQENYPSEPYAGDPKVLVRGNAKASFTLPFTNRMQPEFEAVEEFHATHRKPTHFIFRDRRFVPARDSECYITSSLREQGSDTSYRFNYSFDVAEVS